MQQKKDAYKLQSKALQMACSLQCKKCLVFHPTEVFIDHVKKCKSDNRATRSHFFQIPLTISIQST